MALRRLNTQEEGIMKNLLDEILEDLVKGKNEKKVNALTIDVVPQGLSVHLLGRVYNAMTVEDRERTDMLIAELAKLITKGVEADIAEMLKEKPIPACKECGKCEKESSTKH
jgi:hypothetical protein